MSEIARGFELLDKEWKEAIQIGIMSTLENASLFLTNDADSEYPPAPLDFTPATLLEGEDERGYDELDDYEKAFIEQEFLSAVGFKENSDNIADSYIFTSPDRAEWGGEAKVSVYRTPRSDEGLFVHKIVYAQNHIEYIIAPEHYRL